MSNVVEDLGNLSHASKVEAMAGFGLSADEIARVLKVNADTLKAAYADELEGGPIVANARVAESLYRTALGQGRESVTAAIFWLKVRARWKETSTVEHAPARLTHDDFILHFSENSDRGGALTAPDGGSAR